MFSVHSERAGCVHWLKPVGELDIATTAVLKDEFEAVFGDVDAEMIVVDLTELEFIDSTGVRLLLDINDVCAHVD
jgi:anti-anti-sigma factor